MSEAEKAFRRLVDFKANAEEDAFNWGGYTTVGLVGALVDIIRVLEWQVRQGAAHRRESEGRE